MKKIFKLLLVCLCLPVALTGCYSEMDDKADIDAQYVGGTAPTTSLTSATVTSFSTMEAVGTVDAKGGTVLEAGVMLSTSSDFASFDSYAAEEVSESFTVSISGLNDNTTYYVRSYAVSAANGIVVSEAQTASTPVAPIFDVDGTYTTQEYEIDTETGTESLSATYKVTIAFAEGSDTKVNITNLFEGGETIVGTYNKDRGTITVAQNQIIGVHSSYGNIFIRPVNDEISGYVSSATFTFQSKGGFMNSSIWAASVSAGNFGFYRVKMTHD